MLSYSFQPHDIEPNENVNLTVNALLKEVVTNGTISVDAKVGFIPIYNQQLDLCTEVAAGGLSCPLNATRYDIKQTVAVPDIPIQHGKVDATIKITDQNNHLLLCMKVECRV